MPRSKRRGIKGRIALSAVSQTTGSLLVALGAVEVIRITTQL
jgi:hypothetical protein